MDEGAGFQEGALLLALVLFCSVLVWSGRSRRCVWCDCKVEDPLSGGFNASTTLDDPRREEIIRVSTGQTSRSLDNRVSSASLISALRRLKNSCRRNRYRVSRCTVRSTRVASRAGARWSRSGESGVKDSQRVGCRSIRKSRAGAMSSMIAHGDSRPDSSSVYRRSAVPLAPKRSLGRRARRRIRTSGLACFDSVDAR